MVGAARRSNGRKEQTSFCIVDSQSVKNTDSAEQKGYDAGKKVSGIKRHIAVDTQGLPHAIHVTTANVTDRAGALAMFDQRRDGLSLVQNVLVDGGYTGDPFAAGVQSLLGASVEVVKRNEMHTFVVLPKRWVVERSFAWLEKCRRLWKNCERKLNTSLQMVVLAFAALILKRLQTGSKASSFRSSWASRVSRSPSRESRHFPYSCGLISVRCLGIQKWPPGQHDLNGLGHLSLLGPVDIQRDHSMKLAPA